MNLAFRSTLLVAFAAATFAPQLSSPLRAECVVEPAERAPAPAPVPSPSSNPTAVPFELHEWGVWRLDRDRRVVSLAELARESPSFVHRTSDVTARARTEPSEIMTACEKPVIFVHADAPLELRVSIRFTHGRPWLHYPDASIAEAAGDTGATGESLEWNGRVLVGEALPEGLAYPDAEPTHWWHHLRNARANSFVSNATGETERFLFYDGETELAPGFRRRIGRLRAIEGRVEPIAWVVDGGGLGRLAIDGVVAARTPLGSTTALRDDMRRTLVAAGLTEGEVASLLDTWQSNLFGSGEPHVIWMLPRATYDAMLPLEVTPAARRVVRVGLVIQML